MRADGQRLRAACPDECHRGGKRVEDYLARHRSHRRRWQPPTPDGEGPEAEWGFEPALREDLIAFAARRRFRIRRIRFNEPEQMNPLVADLYADRSQKRGVIGRRLLVESFIVMEPYWTFRTGSAPFWMLFNKEPSAGTLQHYLQQRDPFEEIFMMLFSRGVDSIGLMPIEGWRKILSLAKARGAFIGVDERAYPRDFAVFVRDHDELLRKITVRYPLPPPLLLSELDDFLNQTRGRYGVVWN